MKLSTLLFMIINLIELNTESNIPRQYDELDDILPPSKWKAGMSSLVYFSIPTKEQAEKIGKLLIEKKAAACLNVVPGGTAIFPDSEGKIKAESYVFVIVKTRTSRVPEVVEWIKSLHPDEMPDIVSTPIKTGNRMFLDWAMTKVPDYHKRNLTKATRKPKSKKTSNKPNGGNKKGPSTNDNQKNAINEAEKYEDNDADQQAQNEFADNEDQYQ